MSDFSEDQDMDDPIVQELPVFLSQKAAEDIRLLQYPIRTGNRSLELDEVILYSFDLIQEISVLITLILHLIQK